MSSQISLSLIYALFISSSCSVYQVGQPLNRLEIERDVLWNKLGFEK